MAMPSSRAALDSAEGESLASSTSKSPRATNSSVSSLGDVAEEGRQRDTSFMSHPSSSCCRHASSVSSRADSIDQMFDRGGGLGSMALPGSVERIDWEDHNAKGKGNLQPRQMSALTEHSSGAEGSWGSPSDSPRDSPEPPRRASLQKRDSKVGAAPHPHTPHTHTPEHTDRPNTHTPQHALIRNPLPPPAHSPLTLPPLTLPPSHATTRAGAILCAWHARATLRRGAIGARRRREGVSLGGGHAGPRKLHPAQPDAAIEWALGRVDHR